MGIARRIWREWSRLSVYQRYFLLSTTTASLLVTVLFRANRVMRDADAGLFDWSGVLVIPLLIGVRTFSRLAGENTEQDGAVVRDILKACLKSVLSQPEHGSALIFQLDGKGRLVPTHTYNKDGSPDQDITFDPVNEAGCVSRAWNSWMQWSADLRGITEAELRDKWQMDNEQIRRTAHLKAVLCTPIFKNGDPVGVLAIDCHSCTAAEELGDADVKQKVVLRAAAIGRRGIL